MKKRRCATWHVITSATACPREDGGATTLFATLDFLERKVIGRRLQRHRHQKFIHLSQCCPSFTWYYPYHVLLNA
jgi:hypothetical protein